MKKLLSVLLCVVLTFTAVSITAFAAAPIAKVGEVECYSIAEAVAMVEDGGTIELVAGEITEEINTGRIDKSFTIVGAADYATVVTGGIKIGTDNSSWPIQECTVTVKGITFKNAGVRILDVRNVVVEDNKFENIIGTAAVHIVDPATDAQESNVVVKNNVIDGAEQGIRVRTGYNVEITGNTVKNTQHNAITLEHASKWPANNGIVTIADNTFENWALGGEGRVVRATFGAAEELEKDIAFTGNKMVREEEPAEEYAKLTGVGTTAVNLEKNYWNSDAPDFETIIKIEGGNAEVEVAEYYKAETMKAEDLNTYVAPPTPPSADEDEDKDESKDEAQKDNTADTTDKKDEVKDNKNTSPKTSDNMIAVAILAVSAAALVISARKVK